MEPLRDEYEQAQVVKQWIRDYGPSIAGGVGLGLAGLFGWNAWQDYRYERATAAAQQYSVLLDMLESDTQNAAPLALGLIADFPGTPYAFNAALLLARVQVDAGNLEAAAAQLRWAMDNASPEEMQHVARLRLARVLLAQDQPDAALDLLEGVEPQQFAAAYAEVRGDSLAARGEAAAARSAYEEALEGLAPGVGDRSLLRMKYDDLAVAGGTGTPATEDGSGN